MAEQDAIVRMQLWWATLHPSTQDVFEQLYERDPAMVLDVLGGGEVTPRDGSLRSLLDVDSAMSLMVLVPAIEARDLITFDPERPAPNGRCSARWVEINASQVACPPYMNYLQVFDRDGSVVFDTTIDRPGLGPNESSECWVPLEPLGPGWYRVQAILNSAGAEPTGGVVGETGYAGSTYGDVSVGVADVQTINSAVQQLAVANETLGVERIGQVADALRTLSRAFDIGAPTDSVEALLAFETMTQARMLENKFEHPTYVWDDDVASQFGAEVAALLEPVGLLAFDPASLAEHWGELHPALMAIGLRSLNPY